MAYFRQACGTVAQLKRVERYLLVRKLHYEFGQEASGTPKRGRDGIEDGAPEYASSG